MSTTSSNSFVYTSSTAPRHEEEERSPVIIKYDHAAVTTGGGGGSNEPAWSYRLWNGSIHLSRYLESIASVVENEVVVDLGCGTGLTSIVLGKYCRARRVFATDLSHAMPLLAHNIDENFGVERNAVETSDNDIALPTCPANHMLTPVTADCEDYMCNICDFDIDEGSCIHRCIDCNFDICHKCISKLSSGDVSSLPEWFRLLVNSQRRQSSNPSLVVIPFVYDWNDCSSLHSLVKEINARRSGEDGAVRYIVGADVTYSRQSVELFFKAVSNLAASLRASSSSPSVPCNGPIDLIFAHHDRSVETNDYMNQELQMYFGGKFEDVNFAAITDEDREDIEAHSTGDMRIFRVSL